MRLFVANCLILLYVDLASQTLIAHRGYSSEFPENTLISIEQAINHGFDFIEIDLRTTKDGKIVLLHDETVDRTSNGTGHINHLMYEQVSKLDFGYSDKFGSRYSRAKIPTFSDALEKIERNVHLVLDLKEVQYISDIDNILDEFLFEENHVSFIVYSIGHGLEVKKYFEDARIFLALFTTTKLNEEHLSDVTAAGFDGLAINNRLEISSADFELIQSKHFELIFSNIGSIKEVDPRFLVNGETKFIVDDPRRFPSDYSNSILVHTKNYILFHNPQHEIIHETSLVSFDGKFSAKNLEIDENGLIPTGHLSPGVYIARIFTNMNSYVLKFYQSN